VSSSASKSCAGCARLNEQCVSLERRLGEANMRIADVIASNEAKNQVINEKEQEIRMRERELKEMRSR
jgi:hypothetical protein